MKFLYAGGSIGYLLGQFLLGHPDTIMPLFMTLIYQGFSLFFIFMGANNLHKYRFMTKNIELVKRLNGSRRVQPKNNRTKNV